MPPVGHWASVCPSVSMLCIGLRQASLCGRGDRVPPTNPPLAHSWVYHIRPSFLGEHPPGGAGSARPQRGPRLDGHMPPVGHWASVCPSVSMLCMGLRQASLCGRGDRVPPRKSPSTLSPGFPPKPLTQACPPGGAGSAGPRRIPRVEQGNPHQTIGFWPIVAH
jgi:hypothetical protein